MVRWRGGCLPPLLPRICISNGITRLTHDLSQVGLPKRRQREDCSALMSRSWNTIVKTEACFAVRARARPLWLGRAAPPLRLWPRTQPQVK